MLLCKDDDSVELGSLEEQLGGGAREREGAGERERSRERESTALCVSSKAICVLSIDTQLPALSASLSVSLSFPRSFPLSLSLSPPPSLPLPLSLPLSHSPSLSSSTTWRLWLCLSLLSALVWLIRRLWLHAAPSAPHTPCQPGPCTGCGRD